MGTHDDPGLFSPGVHPGAPADGALRRCPLGPEEGLASVCHQERHPRELLEREIGGAFVALLLLLLL